jgi:O-antigen/teichoic acid export membrane protein
MRLATISPASVFSRALARWVSSETLTHRAFLNSVASAVDYSARLAVGFAINPLLVSGLGSHGYGLWQILRQLTGYLSPAGGRATQALKWTVASHQSSTDYAEKRRFVGSAVVVWCIFLLPMSGLGGLLTWFAPLWLDVREELVATVRLATGLLVAQLILATLSEVPRSVLTGENLGYKRMGLSTLIVLLGGGLMALALYLDTGLAGVAACPLLTAILTGVVFLGVVRRHVAWFGIARPSRDLVRRFLGLSGWFLLWRVVTQAMRASDVVLLGMLLSIDAVTTYSLTKFVPETLVSFVEIVVFGITPGLGGLLGRGEIQRVARVRGEIMVLSWLIAVVAGATILLWNRSFVGLWVGAEHYAGSLPTLWIVLMVTQFVLIRNDANIIDLTLDLRNKVLLGALAAGVSVFAAVVLLEYWELGIEGLCLGFVAGRAILSVAYPWMLGRTLGEPLSGQLRRAMRPICVTALLFGLGVRLSDLVAVGSWPALVGAVAATVACVLVLAFFGGLSGTQRGRLLTRLRRRPRATDAAPGDASR